ncbi:hypothetical protein Hanom_Chr00s129043g01814691 [Helianthus anomalus]
MTSVSVMVVFHHFKKLISMKTHVGIRLKLETSKSDVKYVWRANYKLRVYCASR